MKSMKKVAAVLAIAALQFSAGAQAQTKIEDVAVGSVIQGSIKLHGFIHSAPLPLPPGMWEVIARKDFVVDVWKTTTLPFVQLALKNQDPSAQIRWFSVEFNVETAQVGYSAENCKSHGTPVAFVVNDFGTKNTQFMKRCGWVLAFGDLVQKFPRIKEGKLGPESAWRGVVDHPEVLTTKMMYLYLNAFLSNGRLTSWRMLIDQPKDVDVMTEDGTAAVARFVQDLGDELAKFLHDDKTSLPGGIAWPVAASTN